MAVPKARRKDRNRLHVGSGPLVQRVDDWSRGFQIPQHAILAIQV